MATDYVPQTDNKRQIFVVLSVDVPRRRPDDIVFVNPEDGDAKAFMARNNQ